MNVYKISAVTLLVSDLPKSFNFYYKIPGFKIRYKIDNFVSFQLTNSNEIDNKNSNIRNYKNKTYLNIELRKQDSVSATPPLLTITRVKMPRYGTEMPLTRSVVG